MKNHELKIGDVVRLNGDSNVCNTMTVSGVSTDDDNGVSVEWFDDNRVMRHKYLDADTLVPVDQEGA